MKRVTRMAVYTGLGVGAVAVRRLIERSPAGRSLADPADRWLVVTVNRPQEEIAPQGAWPEPLAELGDEVEIQVRRAPGDKGTEIAVRPRDPAAARSSIASRMTGTSSSQAIRSALRKTKQLLEAGEVLTVDPQPHGKRRSTPGGAVVAAATKRAGREGML